MTLVPGKAISDKMLRYFGKYMFYEIIYVLQGDLLELVPVLVFVDTEEEQCVSL